MSVIKNNQCCVLFLCTHGVFWFLAGIVERLLWKVVSSNQRELSNEDCVPVVGPRCNLENEHPVSDVSC